MHVKTCFQHKEKSINDLNPKPGDETQENQLAYFFLN